MSGQATDRSGQTALVLVADESVSADVAADLAGRWEVRRVPDTESLASAAARERADALVVDLDPGADDLRRAVGSLRADYRAASVPCVALVPDTASAQWLADLGHVVDDYVTKPWARGALAMRLAWATRRNEEISAMAAFTGLPGLVRAREDLHRRLAADETFAYCRLDLDGFAAFNEVYGYSRGDQLILAFAATLRRVAADLTPVPFVGHLAGDDFVLMCAADQGRPACRDVADMFEADSAHLYDEDDRSRGTLRILDRRGRLREIPLVTVSVGIATTEHRRFTGGHHMVAVADEMLAFAKRSDGSSVGVDRRRS